jgi:hypothetical protein
MGFLRDVFGGKNYFAKLDDDQLLDHLADLTVSTRFGDFDLLFKAGGIKSMLAVAFDRLTENPQQHQVLAPVAREMARLEYSQPHSGVMECRDELKFLLRDRYNHNHPHTPWRSLKF